VIAALDLCVRKSALTVDEAWALIKRLDRA
jgi:hypothetical protein